MERWMGYAVASMVFAGMTSVIAKMGLVGISAELGLAVRTVFVFAFVVAFASATVSVAEFQGLTRTNFEWLGLSGVTTAASWVFYYKAIHEGEVSTVAVIDKGSFLIAVLLAALLLGERITPRLAIGCGLILTGLLVVVRR